MIIKLVANVLWKSLVLSMLIDIWQAIVLSIQPNEMFNMFFSILICTALELLQQKAQPND